MKKNIGTSDRIIRFIIASVLLILAYLYSSWILLIFSLFTFYEALASWCVLYQILGKNSCPISHNDKLPKNKP